MAAVAREVAHIKHDITTAFRDQDQMARLEMVRGRASSTRRVTRHTRHTSYMRRFVSPGVGHHPRQEVRPKHLEAVSQLVKRDTVNPLRGLKPT